MDDFLHSLAFGEGIEKVHVYIECSPDAIRRVLDSRPPEFLHASKYKNPIDLFTPSGHGKVEVGKMCNMVFTWVNTGCPHCKNVLKG